MRKADIPGRCWHDRKNDHSFTSDFVEQVSPGVQALLMPVNLRGLFRLSRFCRVNLLSGECSVADRCDSGSLWKGVITLRLNPDCPPKTPSIRRFPNNDESKFYNRTGL